MRRLVLIVLAALAGPCGAQGVESDAVLAKFMRGPIQTSATGWTIGANFGAPTARVWAAEGTGSALKIAASEAITIAGKGGSLAVSAVQRVGLAEGAAAVARCMLGAGLICGVGSAAALAYSVYRIYPTLPGEIACATGGLCFDAGTAPVSQTRYQVAGNCHNGGFLSAVQYGGSITAAADAFAAFMSGANCTSTVPNHSEVWTRTSCTTGGTSGSCTFAVVLNPGATATSDSRVWSVNGTMTSCPASTDPSNPAYSVPAGQPVGPDGKCPTARYNHVPSSETDAAAKMVAYPPGTGLDVQYRDALKLAIESGDQVVPSKLSSSGPSSQTGTPTSTTKTDATGTTTTTTTPTYNYTYAGDKVSYTTTNVTQTCVGASACSPATATSTTTEGAKPAADPVEVVTCGLPGKPACKIDETGTPTTGTISKDEVNASKANALAKISDIGAITAPAWSWSFSLPSACSALSVGPFAGRTVSVDLCAYQSMIHDLASLIWAAFSVWACVGMVGRAFAAG
jgi:hypothetical protein